jgi:fucose permease
LYVIAAIICVSLMAISWRVDYPAPTHQAEEPISLARSTATLTDPHALAFSVGALLYVAVESAVYVWMPTLLADYTGRATWLAAYALTVFLILRTAGRFVGAWMLSRARWTAVLALASGAIFGCFALSVTVGKAAAVWLLPLSGLFMSVVYPTLNSKGISCFLKTCHGAVAGVILFFTCVGAVLGPLATDAVSDVTGDTRSGFVLATGLAALLFGGLMWNWMMDPSRSRLQELEATEYR